MGEPRKVFLSYRSVDKSRVLAIAEQLREAGIDAWLDQWGILPGDDFVAKINHRRCSCSAKNAPYSTPPCRSNRLRSLRRRCPPQRCRCSRSGN